MDNFILRVVILRWENIKAFEYDLREFHRVEVETNVKASKMYCKLLSLDPGFTLFTPWT